MSETPEDTLPTFVTPVERLGETRRALRLSRDDERALRERLDDFDRARAAAMAHAHEVWIR